MAALPDPFMIRAHVPHWEASVAEYRVSSEATRERLAVRRGIRYGDHPDEMLDLFFPGGVANGTAPLPIHVFVHGGYWRSFSRDDYAFVADTVTACGAIAAIVDYSLMPGSRMDLLVAQVRRATRWLADHAATFGGDAGAISASGHSAGGHLASFLVGRGPHEAGTALPDIRSVLLVSGLYDLAPLTRSFLQAEVRFTDQEVARWSPLAAEPAEGADVTVMVGASETAPFHAQAAAFARHLADTGVRHRLVTMPDQDHMTIVRELGRPDSATARHLAWAIAASRGSGR